MFSGRVITKSKTLPVSKFIEITQEAVIDENIPTLIIGKKSAERICGKENIRVLDKKIGENLYWTYSKNERRVDFERDVSEFDSKVINSLGKGIEYVYFNIFTEPFSKSAKFIDYLYNGKRKKYFYRYRNHLYIYIEGDNRVFGLSLEDVDYIGKDKEAVVSKIRANNKNIWFENLDFLDEKLSRWFSERRIMVPYIYFLDSQ